VDPPTDDHGMSGFDPDILRPCVRAATQRGPIPDRCSCSAATG
jgi:hypothetical protein